jgi:hypothetical protein
MGFDLLLLVNVYILQKIINMTRGFQSYNQTNNRFDLVLSRL